VHGELLTSLRPGEPGKAMSSSRSQTPAQSGPAAEGGGRAHGVTLAGAERLRAGDRIAFDAFITAHWAPLVHYIRDRVRVLEHAQDLAQESFARVWEQRERLDPSRSVVAYLYRVARNLVIDELRKLDVRRRWEEEALLDEPGAGLGTFGPGPLQRLEAEETLAALTRAIDTLPVRRREAFLLVHAHGLSYREAAEVMGTAPQTVANQVAAALAEVRRILGMALADTR
jgi:RNA polymerase sigma-70 factor, ECF subfamily